MVKITVLYEHYVRFGPGPIMMGTVVAPNLREALLTLADKLSMYSRREEILEDEKYEGKKFTDEEILDRYFISVNGDGCDIISFIKEETTGKYLYKFPYENDADPDWTVTV